MTIIRAIAFLLHFTIVPVAVGRLITYKQNDGKGEDSVATYILGWFASLGIFYVICSVLVWHQYWNTFNEPFTGCFTALCVAYSILTTILVLIWAKKDFKSIKNYPEIIRLKLRDYRGYFKENKLVIVYATMFIALLIVQLYYAYGYEINEWSYDDYDYVVNSQDTISSDTIAYVNYINGNMPFTAVKRAITAWPTYIAYLSKISGFEVTTVCHTILPVVLIVVAYGVYYYIAKRLFGDYENQIIFLIILATLNIFGFYSHYSPVFRLLGTIWQGKAVLSVIAIPFLIVYLFEVYSSEENRKTVPLAFLSLGICSLTTMSALLVTATALAIWISMCVCKKKVFGWRRLCASLIGVVFLLILYTLMSLLFYDMQTAGNVFFRRGRDINWWYKWFG